MGILTNVPAEQTQEDGAILLKQLADFKPMQITAVYAANEYTGYVIVLFTKDWTGFKNAFEFHNYFKSQHLGKLDWKETKHHVRYVFGWLAKEEDYKSDDPVGRFLSANGVLKTVPQLENEMSCKTDNHIAKLTQQITAKSKYLQELECKSNQMNLSIQKVIEESDLLHKRYDEEMRKMLSAACEYTQRFFQDTENLRNQLAEEESKLERRSKELNEQVAQTHMKRKKLDEEGNKNADQNDSISMARIEQQKADERVPQLFDKHKKEVEVSPNKILQLEKEELTAELNERIEEMEDLEALNRTLLVKERMTNDEIQDAKKELIMSLTDLLGPRSNIRIKRMGELDEKPFVLSCKQRYGEDAECKAAEFVCLWQDHVKNPNWHPFKIVITGSNIEQIIDDKDEKLVDLKKQFGEEVYKAVITALLEINEYNASGSHVVSELWNNKENCKASIAEAIQHIVKQLKSKKRRLTRTS